MNKAFIGILIAVCILGMALIMLNEWKSSRSEPETAPSTLEPAPSAPGELPPNTGSSLTPPVPSEVTAPASSETAAAGGQPPAAAPAPTPSSEALESGFAFNDTEAAAPQDTPPDIPAAEGAARPALDVPPQPALGSGAASEAPAAPAATEERQPAADAERAVQEKKEEKKEEKKAEKPAPVAKARTVTRFVVFARETGATVRIEGSSPIEYKYLPLDNPPRVAVDLMGEWTVKAPGVPKNPAVTNVRLGKLDGRTRVVIDLTGQGKIRHILSKDRKRLDVRIDR